MCMLACALPYWVWLIRPFPTGRCHSWCLCGWPGLHEETPVLGGPGHREKNVGAPEVNVLCKQGLRENEIKFPMFNICCIVWCVLVNKRETIILSAFLSCFTHVPCFVVLSLFSFTFVPKNDGQQQWSRTFFFQHTRLQGYVHLLSSHASSVWTSAYLQFIW